MQAIARANRVFPTKTCGIIVDYVNVFKYMKKALSDYASGDDETEFPAKDIDQLIDKLLFAGCPRSQFRTNVSENRHP